jgi:hypothetical protein
MSIQLSEQTTSSTIITSVKRKRESSLDQEEMEHNLANAQNSGLSSDEKIDHQLSDDAELAKRLYKEEMQREDARIARQLQQEFDIEMKREEKQEENEDEEDEFPPLPSNLQPHHEQKDQYDEMTYEELLELGEKNGDVIPKHHSATNAEIDLLPKHTFKCKETEEEEKSSNPETTECENKCYICLYHFQNNEIIQTLPCIHQFHSDCVLPWFRISFSCPTCRRGCFS